MRDIQSTIRILFHAHRVQLQATHGFQKALNIIFLSLLATEIPSISLICSPRGPWVTNPLEGLQIYVLWKWYSFTVEEKREALSTIWLV